MPKFSYDSWLIIFLFINTVFNVIAMLEFSFVAYIEGQYQLAKMKPQPKPDPKKKASAANELFALPNDEEEEDDDPTCVCFRKLFEPDGKKNKIGAYQKVCNCFYHCVKSYFVASPKVIDKLFRLLFLSAYLLVLFVLFILPLNNQYNS